MPTSTITEISQNEPPKTEYFFEGVEKLLEVWFGTRKELKGSNTDSVGSLRSIPRFEWDALLEGAACRILHSTSNTHLDSYVLSESSLFVSDRRVILKTCGTTKILSTVKQLLLLARKYAGLDQVMNVYYSRKNFSRPDKQPKLYQNFDSEIDFLDRFFMGSSAFCLGSIKSDRWYLYTMSMPQAPQDHPDHTLEILMTEMPLDVLQVFTKAVCIDGKDCTKRAGIEKTLPPGTQVHEELFDPCGYSMNGLIPNSDKYITIHVTPEPSFSYASFETNQDNECLFAQTKRVLDCFRPNKFLLTIFSNEHSRSARETQQQLWDRELFEYRRTNVQFVRLETDETLVYANYVKKAIEVRHISSDEDDGERSD